MKLAVIVKHCQTLRCCCTRRDELLGAGCTSRTVSGMISGTAHIAPSAFSLSYICQLFIISWKLSWCWSINQTSSNRRQAFYCRFRALFQTFLLDFLDSAGPCCIVRLLLICISMTCKVGFVVAAWGTYYKPAKSLKLGQNVMRSLSDEAHRW